MKKIMIMIRATPYGGIRAREALDAVLLFSAFVPDITVLFSGDGVWQLVAGQRPAALNSKSIEATLGAFAPYDITRVYADARALQERSISADGLLAGARALDAAAIRRLIDEHDRVLSF